MTSNYARPRNRTAAALALAALLSGCGERGEPVNPVSTDTIYTGQFVTLDESQPEVEAIAVRDGVIVALGSVAGVEAKVDASAERIRVPGVAVPGWVDAHVHITGYGSLLEMLNVQGMRKQEIVAAVGALASDRSPGEWIIGRGWDEGFFDVEAYPTREDLDAASPDNPVFLARIGGHSAWVNSAALALAGVTATTPDPAGGRIVRGDDGIPTGMLLETAEGLVTAVMPESDSPDVLERQIRLALERYARFGLTGVHDAGTSLAEIEILKTLLAAGELPVRVYAMAQGQAAVQHYLDTGPEIGLGDDRLTIRSFKIMMDGALGARGAEMSEPYADAPETTGLRQMEDEQVAAFFANARARGFQVNAHVIGDLGVERMLDAIERAGVEPGERFRLEHASIISPRNLPRFASLGAIASMQPVFIGEYQRWGEDRVGPERAAWIMPVRDLVESGAVLASGTDYPASDSGDPRATLSALVTRRGADDMPEGGWFPGQAVDVATALWSMSAGPAYAAFQEDLLGVLSLGRYADFTVLAEDPRSAPPERLRHIDVTMTVVGGRVVYRAGD